MELACWLEQTHTQLTTPTDAQTTATADPANEATMLDWLADRGITDTNDLPDDDATDAQADTTIQSHQHRFTRSGRPATNPSGTIPLTGPAAAAAAFGAQATTIGTGTNDRPDDTNTPLAHNRDSIDDQFGLDRLPWLNDDDASVDRQPRWDSDEEIQRRQEVFDSLDFREIIKRGREKRRAAEKSSRPRYHQFGTDGANHSHEYEHGTGYDDGYGL